MPAEKPRKQTVGDPARVSHPAAGLRRGGGLMMLAGSLLAVLFLFPGAATPPPTPGPGMPAQFAPGAVPTIGAPDLSATPEPSPAMQAAAPTPTPAAAPAPTPAGTPAPYRMPSGVDFLLKVPKLGYWAEVREGVSTYVLYYGPGHYPGTPMPGEVGNIGVAAHNSYWTAFAELKAGDRFILETRTASYTYTVASTRITEADDPQALAPTVDKRATLTTCWPLWAGILAKQRFVIVGIQA